jgi:thioredoxin 1
VNVDDAPGVSSQFGIRSIPTLMYFQGGAKKDQSIGVCSKSEILSKLAAL